jgi:hypothetical protein
MANFHVKCIFAERLWTEISIIFEELYLFLNTLRTPICLQSQWWRPFYSSCSLSCVACKNLSSCSIVEPVLGGEDEEAQEEAEWITVRGLQPQQGLNEVAPGFGALRHEGHSV